MATKIELEQAVNAAKKALEQAELNLLNYKFSAEDNVYKSLEEAIEEVTEKLEDQASEDCEGSYNCGLDEYCCPFSVDGVNYIGILRCDYGRHDKTYYFVDRAVFTYKLA